MRHRFAGATAAALAALLVSCPLSPRMLELRIALPQPPAAWTEAFGALSCEVRYAGLAGGAAVVAVGPWLSEGAFVAELPPGAYAPVLATPLVPATGARLRPAGAVFPLDLEPGGRTLRASWEHGCAALLLERLLAAGAAACIEAETLDVEGLMGDMDRSAHGEPWAIDLTALGVSVAASGGREWTCQRLPTAVVQIPAEDLPGWPRPVAYVLDDPFRAALAPPEAGESMLVGSLPVGNHRLFASEGDATPCLRWLTIAVAELEVLWVAGGPGPILRPAFP